MLLVSGKVATSGEALSHKYSPTCGLSKLAPYGTWLAPYGTLSGCLVILFSYCLVLLLFCSPVSCCFLYCNLLWIIIFGLAAVLTCHCIVATLISCLNWLCWLLFVCVRFFSWITSLNKPTFSIHWSIIRKKYGQTELGEAEVTLLMNRAMRT